MNDNYLLKYSVLYLLKNADKKRAREEKCKAFNSRRNVIRCLKENN